MKRIRLIGIFLAVLLLGTLALLILRNREPRYQGRTLTEWIEDGESAYYKFSDRHTDGDLRLLPADPAWQTASHAVKQMAPEAIPFLLKWIQAKDSPLKWNAAVWLDSHPSLHLHIKTGHERNGIAVEGFQLLGEEARPAWPALIQLTYAPGPERRIYAMDCLWESQPPKDIFVPVFVRLIHDPDNDVRVVATSMLHQRLPQEAEAAGVYKMFPSLEKEPTEQSFTNQPAAK